ncbi:MAG: response regulator [Pseudodesulfovibrio sp.]
MSDSQHYILVVDDSDDYRKMVCHYLSEFPCRIVQARDGEEGVELFANGQFDLVIMDIIMPLMDGVEAISAIREMEAISGAAPVPILSLSVEGSVETAVDCINAGATRMIIKPVSKRGLADAVSELLGFEDGDQ